MDKEMTTVVKTGKTTDEAISEALRVLNAKAEDVEVEILKQAKSGFLGFGSSDAMVKVSLKSDVFGQLLEDEKIREISDNTEEIAETPEPEEDFSEPSMDEDLVEEPEESLEESLEIEEVEEEVCESDEAEEDQEAEEDLLQEDNLESSVEDKEETEISEDGSNDSETEEKKAELTPQEAEDFLVNWLEGVLDDMHIIGRVEAETQDGNIYLEIVDISDVDTGIIIGRRAETLNALQYLCSIAINRASKGHRRTYLDVAGYRSRRRTSIEKMSRRCAARVKESHKPIRLEAMNAYERRIVHTALQDMEGITTLSEGREPYRKVVIHYDED